MFTDELTLQIVFESDSIEEDANQLIAGLRNVIERLASDGHVLGQTIDGYTINPESLQLKIRDIRRGSCVIDLWLTVPPEVQQIIISAVAGIISSAVTGAISGLWNWLGREKADQRQEAAPLPERVVTQTPLNDLTEHVFSDRQLGEEYRKIVRILKDGRISIQECRKRTYNPQ